jgi:hypothetical protein
MAILDHSTVYTAVVAPDATRGSTADAAVIRDTPAVLTNCCTAVLVNSTACCMHEFMCM